MPNTLDVIIRNDAAIHKSGSGFLSAQEVKIDGTDLTTPDTIHNVGRIIKSNFQKVAQQVKEKDEGLVEVVVAVDLAGKFSYTTMQADAAHINLPETMDGKYIRFYKELYTKLVGGKKQYAVYAICLIEPGITIDGSNMYPVHNFTCFPVPAAVILVSASISGTFGTTAVTGTIAANEYHFIAEI